MKALVVWGGWGGHEPQQCAERFVPWLEKKGFEVTVSDTLESYLDKELMASLDLIMPIWTMGEISNEQWEALRDTVKAGCPVVGWHGGMCDSFRLNVEYQFMTGGQWVVHLGGIVDYTVSVKRDADGFMDGLNDFAMRSEQYYMHTDPGNYVLANTIISGEFQQTPWVRGTIMPVAWKRRYGKARIFYTSLGHVARDFDVPEVEEIVKRGVMWAARLPWEPEFSSPEINREGYKHTDV